MSGKIGKILFCCIDKRKKKTNPRLQASFTTQVCKSQLSFSYSLKKPQKPYMISFSCPKRYSDKICQDGDFRNHFELYLLEEHTGVGGMDLSHFQAIYSKVFLKGLKNFMKNPDSPAIGSAMQLEAVFAGSEEGGMAE